MRLQTRQSVAVFIGTLIFAVASAAATIAPGPTPAQTEGATLEAVAAISIATLDE